MNIMIFVILFMTSLACSILGVFLILRNLSMLTDAISHSVLLGIVLAYFITKDISSPFLVIGAGLFGLITVFTIESISNTGLVKNHDAVGIVFPLFFAIAVILISKYLRNVHIDTDVVLMGEVILAPLNTIKFLGYEIPKALILSSIMFLLNITFVIVFFKELKLTTFDQDFAKLSGFSQGILFYLLMALTSLTSVVSFDSVGGILVISFFITPGASAYLISKDLKKMIILSGIFSFISCLLGFLLASIYNLSMSGMTASISGLIFLLIVLFNREGIVTSIFVRIRDKRLVKAYSILIHIGNHRGKKDERIELGTASISHHLNWDKKTSFKNLNYLMNRKLIYIDEKKDIYDLTNLGYKKYMDLLKEYGV